MYDDGKNDHFRSNFQRTSQTASVVATHLTDQMDMMWYYSMFVSEAYLSDLGVDSFPCEKHAPNCWAPPMEEPMLLVRGVGSLPHTHNNLTLTSISD